MSDLSDVLRYLQRFAPVHTAAEWDNVGLILGQSRGPVTRIMTCLTVTPAVVREAVDRQVSLIVTHHPVLFRATKKLTDTTPDGRLLLPLLQAGIAVYSPHTAFDNCPGGINDGLAARLGLTSVRPLRLRPAGKAFKLVVFVPVASVELVCDALFTAGAGVIGNYTECSFRTPGRGTFRGNEQSNPVIGERGQREQVSEERVEVLVPESKLTAVLAAMRAAHPYEEVAYDLYPLHVPSSTGEGRLGELPNPQPLGELAKRLKAELRPQVMQMIGEPARLIRRVAVTCGAAGECVGDAIRAEADLFVTGELRFHEGLQAEAAGLSVLLPGHYATERPAIEDLARLLANEFTTLEVFASETETDPFAQATA
ncbi:MAG: Nif3-like dinuclear metal center hexameric protein [Fimbriiglobus sp.]